MSSHRFLLFLLIAITGLIVVAGILPSSVHAADCATVQNGIWNAPIIWTGCGGGTPGATDNVSINHTVTLTQNESAANVTINASGTLNLAGYTLDVKGNWDNSHGGTFNHENGTVQFSASSGSQSLSGDTTFCDVIIDLSSNVTFDWGNNTTTVIAGNLSKSTSGTLNAGTNTTVRFTGACKSNNTATIDGSGAKRFVHLEIASGAAVQHTDGSIYVFGDFSNDGSFTQSSGRTMIFDDDASHTTHALSGNGDTILDNLEVRASNTLTAQTDMTIQGSNFNVASGGTFDGGSQTVTFDGDTSLGGAGTYNFHSILIDSGKTLNGKTYGDHNINLSGDWTNNGTFTHNNGRVTFNGTNVQTIGGAATTTFYDLVVNTGAIVTVPASHQPQADNDVANNGEMRQTRSVGGATSFLHITSSSAADRYWGMDLNGSVGNTEVAIRGNQNTCPNVPAGSYPVKRCYAITPGSAGAVTAKFYYEYGELRSGQDPTTLFVWKDNGNGTWTKITPDSRSACNAGNIGCWVTVNSLPLGSGVNRFVLAHTNPQAVSMARFEGQWLPTGGALLTWETVSEFDLLGFNLYRRASAAQPWQKLNDTLILSPSPGSSLGRTYAWRDMALPQEARITYRLEWVDINGLPSPAGETQVANLSRVLPFRSWLPILH